MLKNYEALIEMMALGFSKFSLSEFLSENIESLPPRGLGLYL